MLQSFFTFTFIMALLVSYCSANANAKLKKCCSKLLDSGDDKDCITRFCDFEGISQANVSIQQNL